MHVADAAPVRAGNPARGVLLAFAAYLAYSLSDASVKLLHGALPPFEVVFAGAVLGLAAVPMVKRPDERWSDLLRSRNRLMWCLRAVAAVAGSVFSVIAFTRLSMAEAMALLFLMPAFVTVLSVVFLKEAVGWRRWSAVLTGFAGVLIVLRPGIEPFTFGHLSAILGAFAAAVTIVILRGLGPTEKRISLYGAGVVGPIAASFLIASPHLVLPPRPSSGSCWATACCRRSAPRCCCWPPSMRPRARWRRRSTARCCGRSLSTRCCSASASTSG